MNFRIVEEIETISRLSTDNIRPSADSTTAYGIIKAGEMIAKSIIHLASVLESK